MASKPRYEIEQIITGSRDDDHDSRFWVRRNGKAFYIDVFPANFINSPLMTRKYLSYLEVLRSGEEVIGDIYDADIYEWIMGPFEKFFEELAPDPARGMKDVSISLKEYLFPEFYVFALDIVHEELHPRRVEVKRSPFRPSFMFFEEDFMDDLETWTTFYDPAGIKIVHDDPRDALFKPPRKVLIGNGQTECFFKACTSGVQIKQELKTYKQIHAAGLDSQIRICHLYGVVMDDNDFILGLLLTYIDKGRPLAWIVDPEDADNPPQLDRQRWMSQIDAAVEKLHEEDIIRGDVKAENVLIDGASNAWLVDFGRGYTRGWVDEQVAGTLEGDTMGVEKLRNLLVPRG